MRKKLKPMAIILEKIDWDGNVIVLYCFELPYMMTEREFCLSYPDYAPDTTGARCNWELHIFYMDGKLPEINLSTGKPK